MGHAKRILSYSDEGQPFCSIQAFNWLHKAHLLWGRPSAILTLLLNVHLIQKHTDQHTQNNVWPNIWTPYGLDKLTHKINNYDEPEIRIEVTRGWELGRMESYCLMETEFQFCFCFYFLVFRFVLFWPRCVACGMWDLRSLTSDWTRVLSSESTESEPLEHQGTPQSFSFARWSVLEMVGGDSCTTLWMYLLYTCCQTYLYA